MKITVDNYLVECDSFTMMTNVTEKETLTLTVDLRDTLQFGEVLRDSHYLSSRLNQGFSNTYDFEGDSDQVLDVRDSLEEHFRDSGLNYDVELSFNEE